MHRGSKYGTCLTPLGQFQTLGGGGVGDSGTSREHAGLLQGAGAGGELGGSESLRIALKTEEECSRNCPRGSPGHVN